MSHANVDIVKKSWLQKFRWKKIRTHVLLIAYSLSTLFSHVLVTWQFNWKNYSNDNSSPIRWICFCCCSCCVLIRNHVFFLARFGQRNVTFFFLLIYDNCNLLNDRLFNFFFSLLLNLFFFLLQVNFLVCQILALFFASFFRSYLHTSKVTTNIRHAFGLTLGLYFGYFCFGQQAIHIAGLPAVCYIIIRTQNPQIVQR